MINESRELIQAIRKSTGISLFSLALDIGMSENTLSRFLRGDNLSQEYFDKITTFLSRY